MISSNVIASALRLGLPILLTALGAIYAERSGVINIGLEGMMIVGSFFGALGAFHYGPAAGILTAILAGVALALIHALATVTFGIDQIVSGVALNILAGGTVRFFCLAFFGMATTSPGVEPLPKISIPVLANIETLKPLTSGISPLIIVGILLVPLNLYVLNRTVFGLRLRSCGENPLAADTLGINVTLMRYLGVAISGAFAGMAGAFLAVEHTGMYVEGMTQGMGFIALAAMIFGNWSPLGACGASALFGYAESLSIHSQKLAVAIPYQFIKMLPYVLTIVVLAGVVGKAIPPAAEGSPYRRGES